MPDFDGFQKGVLAMWRRLLSVLLAAGLLTVAVPARADLLNGGSFDTTTLFGPDNYSIAANLNNWLMLGYSLQAPGPSGAPGDLFAQHSTAGGGTDFRLVQFIDASSLTAGQTLTLEFDYIYAEAAGFDPLARVSLIGIDASRTYSMFGGAGVDGIFNSAGDFGVAAPDVLLAQLELPYIASWSLDRTLSATLTDSYAYIGVVFTSGCFGTGTCNTLRGIDNVSLSLVPEPGTLALLSLGLAGIAAIRRRV